MKRVLWILLPLMVLFQSSTMLGQDEIEIDTRIVNIGVAVYDKDGKPVRGLTKDDFEIYEDGRRVIISSNDSLARR